MHPGGLGNNEHPLTGRIRPAFIFSIMRNKLTEQQKKFCLEYHFNRGNGSKAAIAAGYSENGSRVTASKLLTKANIQNELIRLNKSFNESMAAKGVTKQSIALELSNIAYSSMSEYFDTWITKKEFNKLTDAQRACIYDIETKIEYKPNPDNKTGKRRIEYIRFKVYDKIKAIEVLCKLMGWNEPEKHDIELSGKEQTASNFIRLFQLNDESRD